VLSNLGLEFVLSRTNFGQLHIERVSIFADSIPWHSFGKSKYPLYKVEKVIQGTKNRKVQRDG
jgi:hypothetical protein